MSVLGFELEWFDQVSGILQTLYLKFFLDNNTIELLHNNSIFLKQIFYPDLKLEDLYIGNSITIYNRLLWIKKYANIATTQYMTSRETRYLCLIGRDGFNDVPKLLIFAKSFKLTLGRVITTSSDIDYEQLSASNGDCFIELIGLCLQNPKQLLVDLNRSSRNINAVVARADSISEVFLSSKSSRVDSNSNCTLCLIKPHVIRSQEAGNVLQAIAADRRFSISALFSVHLTAPLAEELLDIYRGVLPNYTLTIEQLCSAPLLAVLITGRDGTDVVSDFRDLTGPINPQLAKVVRPQSLRALFGNDAIKNAVHCTDLSCDGVMECKYIFETVANL